MDSRRILADIASTRQELAVARFTDTSGTNLPQGGNWGCNATGTPRGAYTLQVVDGRPVMHVLRQERAAVADLGPSEVSCLRAFGGGGLDVSRFRELHVRAKLKISGQSISLCGVEASECPLMIEIIYENEKGVEQPWWYQGFYAIELPGFPVNRTTCASCISEHIRINADNWYTFESSDLLELPENYQPTRIKQIKFYVSGHAYEVFIGEVSLYGETG
ncbi:MAG: hypothetical protein HC915_00140 [Anaerolineae bacterium]|nr:hypothetical protein [Anaerolineae bacterium]